ncbi:hypothetical protein VY88_30230 [Azospirillum thiophilum]|uniref:TonB-dependent receptor plug domain-containing protein n=1 Tax=Azospirillum thiophilum TaxID=528244 RepID=A0AAC8W3L1_9PROT|nr:TonB-dependent receptor plug domain-containing protein [Azospirillum thiophilum]ALG74509.1 hypothetical protein AL072_26135 [Azospirillum thiophilum]KJR61683.1 hypothetical protein VY88_30230 [Azospirillum thiophilum]
MPALADDDVTASGGTVSGGIALDPVVVTGATILETPQSVGVVGRQEMEGRNVQTTTQALQYMPGVFASTSPISPRFDYFSVRGALLHGWARCRRPRPRFRLDRPPCPTKPMPFVAITFRGRSAK